MRFRRMILTNLTRRIGAGSIKIAKAERPHPVGLAEVRKHLHGHHMRYSTGISEEPDAAMRTTLNLDEELLARAHELTGIRERTMLLHEGLRLLIQREAARRLARLGGTMPALVTPRRRKSAKRRP